MFSPWCCDVIAHIDPAPTCFSWTNSDRLRYDSCRMRLIPAVMVLTRVLPGIIMMYPLLVIRCHCDLPASVKSQRFLTLTPFS